MASLRSPVGVLTIAFLTGTLSALLIVWLSLAQPWLGLRFSADIPRSVIVSTSIPDGPAQTIPDGAAVLAMGAPLPGAAMPLQVNDIIEDPDALVDPALMRAFFARQAELYQIQSQAQVRLTIAAEGQTRDVVIAPLARRPISTLPLVFWIQIGVGLAGIWLGGWVASLRQHDASAWFFLLAGAGLMVAALSAAFYSSRVFALPAPLFRTASVLNYIGTLTFGVGMINLFLIYPVRLVRPWVLWLAPVALGIPMLITVVNSPLLAVPTQVAVMLAMLVLMGAIVAQIVATRRDPAARVIMNWFGLAVLLGAGGFVMAIIQPALLGVQPQLSQGYAFLFFLIIYLALGVGVTRYRLFDLSDLSFRILFYVGGLAVMLALDAVLIYELSLDRAPALGLSLAVTGLLYLPLRDRLARSFRRDTTLQTDTLFELVTEVALANSVAAQRDNLRILAERLFDPLQISAAPLPVSKPTLVASGESMDIPSPHDLGDLRLTWADQGRRLFSRRDLRQAQGVLRTLTSSLERHRAYEGAVIEERSRINRDMHDNIGILLLGALHSDDIVRKDTLIRQTLKDLREIISNPTHEPMPSRNLFADLRAEIRDLTEAAGLVLIWSDDGLPDVSLSPRQVHTLRALCREAANNILRHSSAKQARFDITTSEGATLSVAIDDDGIGLAKDRTAGHGLDNLRTRLQSCGGGLVVTSTVAGTQLRANLPLNDTGADLSPTAKLHGFSEGRAPL